MRFFSLFSPASLFALATVVIADGASDVLSLTSATFASTVDPESLILVEFFAPWCGHCKALAPHYEEAATALKAKSVKLAKVDCVDEADLCQSHGVEGYPTLKVFRNGTPSDYTGPRKADGIISYMVKQSLPAVTTVTLANHQEFQSADKLVVIAYLTSPTDEPAAEFSATAEKHRDDFLFGLSTEEDAIAAASVTPPAIVVYRSFDEPRTDYPHPVASSTLADIEGWLKDLAIPVIDEVNGENYAIYAGSPKPLAYLFLDPSEDKKADHIAGIKPIAQKYKSKMNFVWIDAIKFSDHAKALNLAEPTWPAFIIQDVGKQLKYPFSQTKTFTPEAVEDWVDQYLAGKLEPQLKSQPIPESQDESVVTIVGKNFDEVVLDDSKDVFLELYASWCGHCKRLKPIWESLGDRYAAIKDRILIAKMEAQENDLPPSAPFRVAGFPTLKFKPAGSRNFLDYDGDRSLESLIAFVEESAKNSLEIPSAPPAETKAQTPLSENLTDVVHDKHDEL
jgi:protein disulfide-isomerase A1